jgi:rSAM/selenodomain-associated transferase 2
MSRFAFYLYSSAWLFDMTGLAVLGPPGNHPYIFGLMYAAAFVLMILMVRAFPVDSSRSQTLIIVFTLGILGRILFLPFPVGNDVYRYVWEGHIQNLGHNPYLHAPNSPLLAEIARSELAPTWDKINHKDFTAAYPPLSLLLFRLLAAVKPDPMVFKIFFAGLDIGVMIFLALIISNRNRPLAALLLYAANPLTIVFIAGEGHLDVIQILFLCLGLYFIFTQKEGLGFLALGLAVMAKYFALIAIPFLVTRKNYKKVLAACIPLVLFIPYVNAGLYIFQSLQAFGFRMHYNDALAGVLRFFFDESMAVVVAMIILFAGLGWLFLFVHAKLRSTYLAIACLLLCLPTLHPWYLAIITPFLVFYPSTAWLYLQAAVAVTFPVLGRELQTGVFQEIHWLKFIEYVPFYGLLLYGLFRDGLIYRYRFYPEPRSISVVIPTLNEAADIGRCLASLKDREGLAEVIVTDGGSADNTCRIARKMGARVVTGEKGRGLQIKPGVDLASGDSLIIVHADCVLQPGAFKAMLNALRGDPYVVGGSFGMNFEVDSFNSRMIAFLNRLRTRLTGISFGDQAQFFRRSALDANGGFPAMMLMEDVELSFRLKEKGRVVLLPDGVRVSSRRWQGDGFVEKFTLVLKLFLRYLIERRLAGSSCVSRNYYTAYYGDR